MMCVCVCVCVCAERGWSYERNKRRTVKRRRDVDSLKKTSLRTNEDSSNKKRNRCFACYFCVSLSRFIDSAVPPG